MMDGKDEGRKRKWWTKTTTMTDGINNNGLQGWTATATTMDCNGNGWQQWTETATMTEGNDGWQWWQQWMAMAKATTMHCNDCGLLRQW